ncbi:MAG: hypothetical protein IT447_07065 [Phycisphaerales bacterium]|jgi:hypothetical protein|nr:hypothetical protein [Phycisphaerales bacterium]
MFRHLFLAGLLMAASAASAQIIYQPVQYQYDAFYYGGDDPAMFAKAHRDSCAQYISTLHRPVDNVPLRVYSDCLPWANAAIYGMTPNDAYNQAYGSVPRYFRKADLLFSARWVQGALVVPVRAPAVPRIEIKPFHRQTPSTQPTARPLLIIPRDALERPTPPIQMVRADRR